MKENATRRLVQPLQSDDIKRSTLLPTPTKARQTRLISSHVPALNVLYTNADQLTSTKRSELLKRIEQEKPLVIAICEVKPKNSKERTTMDYQIPGFSLHPTNIGPDSNIGRGIAVYTHCSIDQSVMQIQPEISYHEVGLLEIRLRGGDILLFGCFYRSPTLSNMSEQNNGNLHKLLRCISRKK